MNGFEPLRRRIIDYTDAGQWSEVYDGPIEGCETEQLKVENAKLRELVRDMRTCIDHACMCEFCPLFISEDMNERRCIADMKAHMHELGVEP